ncbi:MAG: succinate dehydrogenase, hydrophobic membrane anchor protein [Alphaproteobacteria bacterium]|nr:succinate dehydrogenase, hydrophobic membrane anchor protein [Alphaproteobacteria bacterium]
MSLETPLHKVGGLGSAHSGVGHFMRQRITAIALIPLTVWFAVSALGLIGAKEVSELIFLSNPLNAVLLGTFILISLYHLAMGLREVVVDYVPHEGFKLFLMLLNYGFAIAVAAACLFALARISIV